MKTAKIADLKNNLSRLLAYVRRGGTVRVFDGDSPIADLVPCRTSSACDDAEQWLSALERDGIIKRGTGTLPEGFLTRKLPRARKSVVQALLDERDAGR